MAGDFGYYESAIDQGGFLIACILLSADLAVLAMAVMVGAGGCGRLQDQADGC